MSSMTAANVTTMAFDGGARWDDWTITDNDFGGVDIQMSEHPEAIIRLAFDDATIEVFLFTRNYVNRGAYHFSGAYSETLAAETISRLLEMQEDL